MNTTINNSSTNPNLQLKNVVTTPPNNGPMAAAIPAIALLIARAKVRLLSLYVPLIMEIVAGVINAPPNPSSKDHPINNVVAF